MFKMENIILKGKKSEYEFSLQNALKLNAKFNNVFVGKDLNNNQKVIIKHLNQNLSTKEIKNSFFGV